MAVTRLTGQPNAELTLAEAATVLSWLADAPLFIDDAQVGALWDAVVRPEGRRGRTVVSLARYEGQATRMAALDGEVSLSRLLTTLLPCLSVNSAAGPATRLEPTGVGRGETVELLPAETPQRQLVQLTLHYLAHLPRRIRLVGDPTRPGWHSEEWIAAAPRALVFLDFAGAAKDLGGTLFMPMAAEIEGGQVVTCCDQLRTLDGSPRAAYPDHHIFATDEEYAGAMTKYWQWFERVDPRSAMKAVESAVLGKGRIQWIDYRALLPGQPPLYLHLDARGRYDTGTFAYSLVKRGFRHGLRMVGTLKSEPGLNVLAIYEK
jgi:hypothetical protein